MKKKAIKEADLYIPVKTFLEQNGYCVRAEVRDCDITAVKGDELIVIELKTGMNFSLLVQATQRQKITDSVYVAIPAPKRGIRTRQWRKVEHVLRRLELGLIVVDLRLKRSPVHLVLHPLPFDRKKKPGERRAILQEIENRSGDYNTGGTVRAKRMTAYREQAIFIACLLDRFGEMTPRQLRDHGTCEKTQSILYNNHYGWFERVGRGIYAIKPTAMGKIQSYAEIVSYYQKKIDLSS